MKNPREFAKSKPIKDGWHGARLGLATSPTPCRMWEDPKGKELGLASNAGVWDSLPNPTGEQVVARDVPTDPQHAGFTI